MIQTASDNGCSISSLNQIQRQSGRRWADSERTFIEARLWSKVKKTDSCWLWTGSVTGGGKVKHGRVIFPPKRDKRYEAAHRLSWELTYGPIPTGLQVCHHCDVPRCVRPEHLFLGTQDDNLKDAARKRRFHRPRARKLTEAQRLAIYHMPDRRGLGVELALHYGVTKACIHFIRKGRFIGSPFDQAVS